MGLTYFAYGSNMLSARLLARCTSARAVGIGTLDGWGLSFGKRGRDGSGKGTLAAGPGGLPGVLFHLSQADAALLDAIEGPGYARRAARVTTAAGPCPAFTYDAIAPEAGLVPFDWYVDLIRAGRAEHGLAPLGEVACAPDPETQRPGRLEALAALARR